MARIGHLKEKSRGIGQHFRIDLFLNEKEYKIKKINWGRETVDGTILTHPGIYCLPTNELS
jgi:hypothetical protein